MEVETSLTRRARRPAAAGGRETSIGVPTRVDARSNAFSDAGSTPAASTNITDGCDTIRGRVPGLGPSDPNQLAPSRSHRRAAQRVSSRARSQRSRGSSARSSTLRSAIAAVLVPSVGHGRSGGTRAPTSSAHASPRRAATPRSRPKASERQRSQSASREHEQATIRGYARMGDRYEAGHVSSRSNSRARVPIPARSSNAYSHRRFVSGSNMPPLSALPKSGFRSSCAKSMGA